MRAETKVERELVLDRSAVLAVVGAGPDADRVAQWIRLSPGLAIGAPTAAAAAIALVRKYGSAGRSVFSRFLEENEVVSIPFDGRHWSTAADAQLRFGPGRHAAALGELDCMTYATARLAERPLLCTGAGFARTDLAVA
jgi:ribonuclease VapC